MHSNKNCLIKASYEFSSFQTVAFVFNATALHRVSIAKELVTSLKKFGVQRGFSTRINISKADQHHCSILHFINRYNAGLKEGERV